MNLNQIITFSASLITIMTFARAKIVNKHLKQHSFKFTFENTNVIFPTFKIVEYKKRNQYLKKVVILLFRISFKLEYSTKL